MTNQRSLHISIYNSDVDIINWLASQNNKSSSIRHLIRRNIAEHGGQDVFATVSDTSGDINDKVDMLGGVDSYTSVIQSEVEDIKASDVVTNVDPPKVSSNNTPSSGITMDTSILDELETSDTGVEDSVDNSNSDLENDLQAMLDS